MKMLWQDIKYGFRMLARSPGFAVVVVLILAVGIGATTSVFSIVDGVLLRALPYKDPERLVAIDEHNVKGGYGMAVSPRLLLDMQEQTRSFEEIAFSADVPFHLTGGEFPEKVDASRASANLFGLLGARPLLGRTFLPGEDQPGNSEVAVISQGLWQRRFGSDPNVLEKTISFTDMQPGLITFRSGEDKLYTVIGVMPQRFLPCRSSGKCEIWVPLVFQGDELNDRTGRALFPVGRLKAGVTPKQARAEVDVLLQRLTKQYPQFYEGWIIRVQPLRQTFMGGAQHSLLMLVGAVAFVLLIACANVANMLLARAASRQREVAVRASLGAGHWRLVRQLLTESVLLAFLGAALGLVLTRWSIGLLKPLIPPRLPAGWQIGMDARMFGFALLILVATGVGCGLAPAWQLSRTNLTEALKEGGGVSVGVPGRKLFRSFLVVSQVALALVLLIGAGLLIQTVVQLLRVDPGFNPRNLLEFHIDLPLTRYGGFGPQAFFEQLLERITSLPGVQSVGAVSGVGLSGACTAEGQTTSVDVSSLACSVGNYDYLRTMGIALLQGRYLTKEDIIGGDNNVIINEAAARQFWPGENPIGKRISRGLDLVTVVGVVKTTRTWSYAYEGGPLLYNPYNMDPMRVRPLHADFVVRSTGDPLNLVRAIRGEVAALDNYLPVTDFMKLEEQLFQSTAGQRFYMRLLTFFATMGLILAAIGIYGVISYLVAQQTHEIGIRMTLGAQRGNVLKLVIKKGVTMIVVGIGIGVAGALALTRVLASLLYDVTPTDPATFVAVCLLLTAVGLIACYIPARRAAKIDPVVALRYE